MARFDPARLTDTIAAPITPPGRGGVAVVRISGSATLEVVRRVFRRKGRHREETPPERRPSRGLAAGAGPVASFSGRDGFSPPPRLAILGDVVDPTSGEALDEALLLFFPAPHSYTGEDVAEVSLHGSPVLVGCLMEFLGAAGARPAEPGEFTQRAFRRGKIDLCQAEAVRALTESRTRLQARLAHRQLTGETAALVRPARDALVALIVGLEARLEFEEDQGGLGGVADPLGAVNPIRESLARLERGFHFANLAEKGFTLVLTGRPNAGKSTLFNAMLGAERALVTAVPGTTRDALREAANLYGIPAQLVDTAGIRDPADAVEALSIERTRRALADADAVVWVVDSTLPWSDDDDRTAAELQSDRVLLALNKIDLPNGLLTETHLQQRFPGHPVVAVSARTGGNLDTLRQALYRLILPESDTAAEEQPVLVSARQQDCVRDAGSELDQANALLAAGHSEEFALLHLRRALAALDNLTGETSVEEMLGNLFASFCIGK